jgi:hypothetical protein
MAPTRFLLVPQENGTAAQAHTQAHKHGVLVGPMVTGVAAPQLAIRSALHFRRALATVVSMRVFTVIRARKHAVLATMALPLSALAVMAPGPDRTRPALLQGIR